MSKKQKQETYCIMGMNPYCDTCDFFKENTSKKSNPFVMFDGDCMCTKEKLDEYIKEQKYNLKFLEKMINYMLEKHNSIKDTIIDLERKINEEEVK